MTVEEKTGNTLVLGIDLETNGLDTKNDKITEIGCVLWDAVTLKPKVIYNEMLYDETITIPTAVVELTGITPDDVYDFGLDAKMVLERVNGLIASANCVVAHNGNAFDKPFLERVMSEHGIKMIDKLWIDTQQDVDYPATMRSTKLTYLAADHGFLNPFAHRAVFDVLSMLKILANYDIKKVARNAKEPKYLVQAECEKPWEDGGASTSIAKEQGFRWDGQQKKWLRTLRKSQYEEMTKESSLKLVILE